MSAATASPRCSEASDSVAVELGDPELVQHVHALFGWRWLFERAAQVCHSGLRSALGERALRSLAKRCDDERIMVGKRLREVRRGLLRKRSGIEQNLGCAAVAAYSFDRAHVLEDRCANNRMHELDRGLVPEKVGPNERARGFQRRRQIEPRERSGDR